MLPLKTTSESIMRRSISYEWITSSSFSTAKNVRRRNEKINEINVTTFGWVYIHNSVCFWVTMEILVYFKRYYFFGISSAVVPIYCSSDGLLSLIYNFP